MIGDFSIKKITLSFANPGLVIYPELLKDKDNKEPVERMQTMNNTDFGATGENETRIQRYHRLRGLLLKATDAIINFVADENSEHVLLEDLRKIQEELTEDRFKIGLFGVTAAGKSTLTNALLRGSILKEGLGETTRTLSRITAPLDGYGHGQVFVRYKTLDQIECDLEDHLRAIGWAYEQGFTLNLGDPAFRAELRTKLRDGSDTDFDVQSSYKYLRNLLTGWDECEPMLGKEVSMTIAESDDLVHQEKVATYVDERIIFHDNPITGEGFILYDAPGVGSSYARHTEEAENLARRVDAAIIVTKVDYKFMPPDRSFIEKAWDVQRMERLRNLIFVLNQIQKIDPVQSGRAPEQFDECVEEQIAILKERLTEMGITQAPVLAVDAACGRWSRQYAENPDDSMAKGQFRRYSFPHLDTDPQANLQTSRLADLEEWLKKHLTSIRYYGFLAGKLGDLKGVNRSYRTENETRLDGLDEELGKLQEKLAIHTKHKEETEAALTDFFKYILPGRIKDKYSDLEGEIEQVIDKSVKKIARVYAGNYWRPVEHNTNYVKWVLEEASDPVKKWISEVRDKYETRYSEIRANAIEKSIPKIIKIYGGGIDWELKQSDITKAVAFSIKGLERIDLGFWQSVVVEVRSWFGNKDKEQEGIARKIEKNFRAKCELQLRKDITAWVEADRKTFGEQVETKFYKLMAQIEQSIRNRLKDVELKGEDREAQKRRIEVFIAKCKEIAADLAELEKEIGSVRQDYENPAAP